VSDVVVFDGSPIITNISFDGVGNIETVDITGDSTIIVFDDNPSEIVVLEEMAFEVITIIMPPETVEVFDRPSFDILEVNRQGPTGPQGQQGLQGLQGLQGIQGIQGIQGLGVDSAYEFTQSAPVTSTTITHSLGKHPSVSILSLAGKVLNAAVTHLSTASVLVEFGTPVSFVAAFN